MPTIEVGPRQAESRSHIMLVVTFRIRELLGQTWIIHAARTFCRMWDIIIVRTPKDTSPRLLSISGALLLQNSTYKNRFIKPSKLAAASLIKKLHFKGEDKKNEQKINEPSQISFQ